MSEGRHRAFVSDIPEKSSACHCAASVAAAFLILADANREGRRDMQDVESGPRLSGHPDEDEPSDRDLILGIVGDLVALQATVAALAHAAPPQAGEAARTALEQLMQTAYPLAAADANGGLAAPEAGLLRRVIRERA